MAPRIFTVTPNPVLDRTLTVPQLILDDVLRAAEVHLDAGGKGFNVSRALAAMGTPSTAMAFLGGSTGQKLAQMMAARGVLCDFTPIAEETRTNIVVQEPGGRHLKVNEAGPEIAPDEVQAMLSRIGEVAQEGDIWVFAGSLPRGVAADFYRICIATVQARGARAVLDVNGDSLLEGLRARPFLAKPNLQEAGQATGREVRTIDDAWCALQSLIDGGVIIAAISMGADGLITANGGQFVWARPPSVVARNTVGAGDATVAGMIWALAQGWELEECARYGVACGTTAVTRPGVDFGALDEVKTMAQRILVEEGAGKA